MKLVCFRKNFFYYFLYLFLFFNLSNLSLYAFNKNNNQTNQTNQINKISNFSFKKNDNETFIDQYILDSGDVLSFYFEGLEIFSNDYSIDRSGYLNLPEIGFYYARGQSVSEINNYLNKKYEEFIYAPNIKIVIAKFRPIKIFLSGEVNNPGFININRKDSYFIEDNKLINDKSSILKFPELFDVLKLGQGVTNYADLSKIEVIRNNPIKYGGGKKKAVINLMDLIFKGNQEKNIYIYDDDVIHIPKSDKVIKEQFLAINKINLNPKFINVYLSGNVVNAGMQPVKKGSSLVQAIASSGGKKLFSGKVEFIRFNNEGDIERRLIRYDSSAKVDSYKNPLLIEGDIINVKRTPIGVFTAGLNEVTPSILNSLVLVELFGEN